MAWHRRCWHLLNLVHDAQSRTVKVRGPMHTIVGRAAQMQRTVLELENVRNRWWRALIPDREQFLSKTELSRNGLFRNAASRNPP